MPSSSRADVGELAQDAREFRRRILALIAVAVAISLPTACASTARVDQATATRTATDSFASAHGSGTTVSNVKIESIEFGVNAGRWAWKVNISGDVTEAGRSTKAYTSHEWLYVYADTGEVRVFAQG